MISGYVYRGREFAHDISGKYIFGDNVFRTVWARKAAATPVGKTHLCVLPKGTGPNAGTDYTGLSSFGTDAEGELYFCQMSSIGGRIFKLQRGGPPPPARTLPLLLSQTGLFKSLPDLQPADFLLPYTVNSPLWSDGAVKTRWFTVPAGTTIGFSATGEWTFPPGSVFVKLFALPVDDTNPQTLRRLETRLLVRDTAGYVYGATYKWRADNSDADLITNGFNEDVVIRTVAGTRTQRWFYPGRQDCLTCHTPASGGVLGVKTRQLNGNFAYPDGVTANQLRTLGHLDLFDAAFDDRRVSRYPRSVNITNAAANLEWRVRSYLDANCSMCHRPGGAGAFFDARFETPLDQQGLVNGAVANLLGVPGAKVIVPADLSRSLIFHRISIVGENQMPPLARNLVDTNALEVVGRWIMALHARPPELPKGWSSADIGGVGVSGTADFLSGRFNLLASGSDIWETADAFHFASRPLAGDGSIVARVVSVQYTDPWAKAGVMLREDDAPGAKYVFLGLTGQGGSVLQSRLAANGSSDSADGPDAKPPRWLKLVRTGNVFAGYISSDGVNWAATGSVTNSLPKKVLAGLALTSHNNGVLNSTLFENVSIEATGAPKTEKH